MHNFPERFAQKVAFQQDGCWLWKAYIGKAGYGRYGVKNKVEHAHRMSWIFSNGVIPDGLCVLHKCDVRACVNPDHLFLGTHSDNAWDKVRKGRHPGKRAKLPKGSNHWSRKSPELVKRGTDNNKAKVTPEIVQKIRSSYRRGTNRKSEFSYSGLAQKYGLTLNAVRCIVRRETWSHVD